VRRESGSLRQSSDLVLNIPEAVSGPSLSPSLSRNARPQLLTRPCSFLSVCLPASPRQRGCEELAPATPSQCFRVRRSSALANQEVLRSNSRAVSLSSLAATVSCSLLQGITADRLAQTSSSCTPREPDPNQGGLPSRRPLPIMCHTPDVRRVPGVV